MFCDCCFVSKYFLHFGHCYASTVFFTWIIIHIRLYMSCLWKQFMDEMLHQKTLAKKAPIVFGFQVWDLNISDIFYKSQKFNWWPVCPVITHWTYTCLSPWAMCPWQISCLRICRVESIIFLYKSRCLWVCLFLQLPWEQD